MTDSENKTKKIKLSSSCDDSQRLKIVGSGDDGEAAAGSSNNVLSSSPKSRSPEESVFSIDHILESILENCDRQALFNSRLVSRRWAIYGSKELQKIVCIVFHKLEFASGKPLVTRKKRSLPDLMTVMDNSHEFPCNSFEFANSIEGRTRHSTPFWFFKAHGFAIKKVTFQNVPIDDLKRFLLKQAPNLQQLHLGRVKVNYFHSAKGEPPNSEPEEQQSERERCAESLFDAVSSKPKPILKNLKTFRCRVHVEVPEILIQQILECSPNLVDVTVPAEHLRHLVQPTNRVHLVKKLTIGINSSNIESYELFANHLQHNEDFAVRELCYRTGEYEDDDDDYDNEEFHARVTKLCGKFLRASSATCRKLMWLREDSLEISRMPQLKHLTIQFVLKSDTGDDDTQPLVPVNGMREGVSLRDTFPNLKSLELRSEGFVGQNRPIANIFNGVDPLWAANVKTVTLRSWRPSENVVRSFKEMFPNAAFWNRDEESGANETKNDEADDFEFLKKGRRR